MESPANSPSLSKAYFAGGCFWCIEADFQKVAGVREVISGYAGGTTMQPTYEQVVSGSTGHREAIEVTYDPRVVTYAQLVEYFFDHIDPTDAGGQFADRGESYTSAIFYQNEAEKQDAERIKAWLNEQGIYDSPVVTLLLPYTNFYPAEDYHQQYAEKNALRYNLYRTASGRDALQERVCRVKLEKRLPLFSGKLKDPPTAEAGQR